MAFSEGGLEVSAALAGANVTSVIAAACDGRTALRGLATLQSMAEPVAGSKPQRVDCKRRGVVFPRLPSVLRAPVRQIAKYFPVPRRQILRALAAALGIAAAIAPSAGSAGAVPAVDLQLVLAVDVSGSIDRAELRIQRNGYVQAFRDPEVIRAIGSGLYGRIAVTYLEWSSPNFQVVVLPWTILSDAPSALTFATELAQAPFNRDRTTSISAGLLLARDLLQGSGIASERRTIDVSGDGPNNDGRAVARTRDAIVAQGIVINGLPILLDPTAMPIGISLEDYYRACVIGGPGSFVIPVKEPGQFEIAITQKLILEIAGLVPQIILASTPTGPVDCMLGEKMRPPIQPR